MAALHRAGKTSIAAVLPDNAFGDALLDGLNRAARRRRAALVRRYPTAAPPRWTPAPCGT